MKTKSKKILAVLLVLILLPSVWSIAIGPRQLDVGTAEVYEQRIYYQFHTYKCEGWTMGGKNTTKSGRCIKYGLFACYYNAKGSDRNRFIIKKELHERFVYEREDFIKARKTVDKGEIG